MTEEKNEAYCNTCEKVVEVDFSWIFKSNPDNIPRDYTDVICRECKCILLTAEGHIRFSQY